jgi:Protein of unknown function (DUF2591)
MKIKTNDLTSTALDWCAFAALIKDNDEAADLSISVIDGVPCVSYTAGSDTAVLHYFPGSNVLNVIRMKRKHPKLLEFATPFRPSSSCENGGLIIDQEKIGVWWDGQWHAKYDGCKPSEVQDAHAPLIAAMRCFVASKLGDEVEVPDELINQPG